MFTFHHLAITVKHLDRSITFYSLFGFRELGRWRTEDDARTIVHLKLGDCILELFNYTQTKSPLIPKLPLDEHLLHRGIQHLALRVNSIADAAMVLRREGLTTDTDITTGKTGIKYFFMKDPDGNFLEIVEDNRNLTPNP